jgi:hypothetical protein
LISSSNRFKIWAFMPAGTSFKERILAWAERPRRPTGCGYAASTGEGRKLS